MDEALKARLIGATLLVALAVLLIPELLSGRKPVAPDVAQAEGVRGTRTFTIDLGGGVPSTASPQPPPTLAPQPVAGAAPAVAAPATPTPARAAAAEPEPAPVLQDELLPPAAAPAIPARGGWAVQVGAFGSADTANRLVKQLAAAGYQAFIAPVSRSGKALHRVRVGPEAERAGAEALVAGLKSRGLPATVVAND